MVIVFRVHSALSQEFISEVIRARNLELPHRIHVGIADELAFRSILFAIADVQVSIRGFADCQSLRDLLVQGRGRGLEPLLRPRKGVAPVDPIIILIGVEVVIPVIELIDEVVAHIVHLLDVFGGQEREDLHDLSLVALFLGDLVHDNHKGAGANAHADHHDREKDAQTLPVTCADDYFVQVALGLDSSHSQGADPVNQDEIDLLLELVGGQIVDCKAGWA